MACAYLLHAVEMPVCVGEGALGAPPALVAGEEVDAGDGGALFDRIVVVEDGLAEVVVFVAVVPLELVAATALPLPSLPTRACPAALALPEGAERGV